MEAPVKDVNLSEWMAETEREIERLLEREKQAKREESERRRQAKMDARANGESSDNWPRHLPMCEITRDILEYAKCCDSCDQARVIIGYATSSRLEYTTQTVVLVTKTPIVACKSHHGGPVTEAVEPKPVDSGRTGFSLAAQVVYLRYTRNIPVYSIVEMLQAQDVPISEEMVHTLIRVTAKHGQAREARDGRTGGQSPAVHAGQSGRHAGAGAEDQR
ncbi:MAG: transposase [Myxococcota bacterium]